MKIKITLEKKDYDYLSDIILDATGEVKTKAEIKEIWEDLPDTVKGEAIQFGIDDSVARDNIYEHLNK